MNVLLPVDGSEYSEAAVEAVASRPWPRGSAVRVLHVVPSAALAAGMYSPPPPAMAVNTSPTWPGELVETHKRFTERGEQITARAADRLRRAGLEVDTRIREGDPRDAIIDEATTWPADLIAMGSHGYTGLKRLLLGSVAQSVLTHAPCSIEIVRKPGQSGAAGSAA